MNPTGVSKIMQTRQVWLRATACAPCVNAFCQFQYAFVRGKFLLCFAFKEGSMVDSVLKSKGITLPTKVHIVKAMVFPVVIYGCESWTIKKTEQKN